MKKSDRLKTLEAVHPLYAESIKKLLEIDDLIFDGVNKNKDKYLPKAGAESSAAYDFRKTLSRFKGELSHHISRSVGAVFSIPPSRPKTLTAQFSEMIDNANGTGDDLDAYLGSCLYDAIGFGASLVLVEKPQTEFEKVDGAEHRDTGIVVEEESLGFQKVKTDRKIRDGEINLCKFKLSQAVNWEVDRRGRFQWLRLKEVVISQPTPSDLPKEITYYREYDRKSWRIWKVVEDERKNQDAVIDSEGDHNLGIVPVAVLGIKRNGSHFSFESPVRYAMHYDIEKFQSESDIAYDTFQHAHPTKFRKTDKDKNTLTPIGPNSEIILEADEEAGYLKYPTEATKELRLNKQDSISGLGRSFGLDPLGSSDSASAMGASGRARQVAFTIGEARYLKQYSKAVANCEMQIFEIAMRWQSDDENLNSHEMLNDKAPTYNHRFDTSQADELVSNWLDTRGLINSDVYDKEMQNKIVDKLLPELPPATRSEVLKEIEDNKLLGKQVDLDFGTGNEGLSLAGDADEAMDQIDSNQNENGVQ